MNEDQVTLCRLEAEVCACGSGVNIGIEHFDALVSRDWCEDAEDGEDEHPLEQA